jgi:hypothetical protein
MPTFAEAMPDGHDAFTRITGIFSSTLSIIANFVIVIFVDTYLAVDGRAKCWTSSVLPCGSGSSAR